MPKIPAPTGGDYPELPEKDWIEFKIDSISPFDDTRFPNKDGSPKPRFEIIVSPTAEEYEGTRVWVYAGRSWHEKSNLYKIAQATFPKPIADEELYEMDTDDLVGKVFLGMGKYGADDADHKFLKLTDYKSTAKPAATRNAKPAAKAAAPKGTNDGDIEI